MLCMALFVLSVLRAPQANHYTAKLLDLEWDMSVSKIHAAADLVNAVAISNLFTH